MQFTHVGILYITFAVLLPLLVVMALWSRWRRQQDLRAFGSVVLVEQLMPHLSATRRLIRGLTLFAGLFLLGLALAGPQFGAKMVEVVRQGRDVVIALDVSQSMLAEDVRPNRLQRAQQELTFLIDHLRGDRIGILAFSGSAQVACPLTTDYSAAKMFLNYLSPESVPVPGTSIGAAIQTAVDLFPQGSEGFRVLVLLTDGEDHDSKVDEAAQAAKAAGVRILAIGFGTPQGEPIPIRDASGSISGYLKDQSGKTVVSQLGEKTLRQITSITGGTYLPAYHGSLEAKQIADLIDQMRKRNISGGQYGAMEDRYQFVLLPGLLLLLFAFWLPERKRSWLLVFLLCFVLPQMSRAGTAEDVNKGNRQYRKGQYEAAVQAYRDAEIKQPKHPVVEYNLGNALQKEKKNEEAEKAYQKALKSKNQTLRAKTLYNLGNNYYAQKKYQEAVKHYHEALKLKPRDEDTIYNLSQAMLMLKNPQAPQDQKNKKDQQQQQNQDGQQGQQEKDRQQNSDQQKQEGQQNQDKNEKKDQDQKSAAGPDDRGEAKADQKAGSEQNTPMEAPRRVPKPGEMQPEEAESILNAVREAEKEAQKERLKKLQQQAPQRGNKAYW